MSVEEMQNSLDKIINLYKDMEHEYGVDLTAKIWCVQRVKEDIPEAIWYAEVGKDL